MMKTKIVMLTIALANLTYADTLVSGGSVSPAPQDQKHSSKTDSSDTETDPPQTDQDDVIIMEEDNEDSYEEDDTGETPHD